MNHPVGGTTPRCGNCICARTITTLKNRRIFKANGNSLLHTSQHALLLYMNIWTWNVSRWHPEKMRAVGKRGGWNSLLECTLCWEMLVSRCSQATSGDGACREHWGQMMSDEESFCSLLSFYPKRAVWKREIAQGHQRWCFMPGSLWTQEIWPGWSLTSFMQAAAIWGRLYGPKAEPHRAAPQTGMWEVLLP